MRTEPEAARSLPLAASTGIERVSRHALASADRKWTGNDRSGRQHHARLPTDTEHFTLSLSWRESPADPVHSIGTFRIHLGTLLAHGLVYEDGPGMLRLRFVHAKDGSFYCQCRASGPRVLIGTLSAASGSQESSLPHRVDAQHSLQAHAPAPTSSSIASLKAFRFDGTAALEHALSSSPYGSIENAVAALSVFTNPETVRQAEARALFRIIRGRGPDRGSIVEHPDGNRVMLDDNTGPTDAYLWANGLRRGSTADMQFCHIWQASADPDAYTNLANLCLLPAFLSKLSDTHPRVTKLLRWRAETLYGWRPAGEPPTAKPGLASELPWADPLRAVGNLEAVLRAAMRTKQRSRTVVSAREIGWVFSGYRPDPMLSAD